MEYSVEILAEAFWDCTSFGYSTYPNCSWSWCAKNDPELAQNFREKAKLTIEKAKLISANNEIDLSLKDALVSSR